MIIPIRQNIDCDPTVDDTVTFYSRSFDGGRIVIVPKSIFEASETHAAFILTFKN